MVIVKVSVHPQGLGPTEAAKAWYMRVVQKMKWLQCPWWVCTQALDQNAKDEKRTMG